jgi:Spy/CpxP family protein refolding chaperone
MLFKFLLGALIGLSIVRFIAFKRLLRLQRFAGGAGRFARFGGPFHLLHGLRSLGLDAQQRVHVKEMMIELRRLGTELRFARFDAREDLAAALGGEQFDRARLEALADKQLDSLARARKGMLDHLEALHASLGTEQRARLRELLGTAGAAVPASEPHPYR